MLMWSDQDADKSMLRITALSAISDMCSRMETVLLWVINARPGTTQLETAHLAMMAGHLLQANAQSPGNGGSNNGGSSAPADPNCVESANGACTKCASRWYLSNGVCTAVSNQCNTWDENTGACTSCFDGWTLNAGQCQSAGQQSTSSDPNCNQSDANGVCTKCNFRWVLKNGTCSQLATNARLGTTQLELAHLATTAGLSQQANALFEIEMIIHTSILFPIN